MSRTTVIIESPFQGDQILNIAYARECMLDSLQRGEAPFLSHLLYTQVLDESKKTERNLGIQAGLEFGRLCEKTAVYKDLGISAGMKLGIASAKKHGRPVEMRIIPGFVDMIPETIAARIWKLPNKELLFKRTRLREVVEARMVLLWYRNQSVGQSQAKSAAVYGMDHCATIHAGKKISEFLETDKQFRARYEEFTNAVKII